MQNTDLQNYADSHTR